MGESEPTEAGQAVWKENSTGQVHRTTWRDDTAGRYLGTVCGVSATWKKVVVDPEDVPEHRACWNCWGRIIRARRAATEKSA